MIPQSPLVAMQETSTTNVNKRLETSSNHLGGAVNKKEIPLVYQGKKLDKAGMSISDYR